jgi:hypothetical protein
VDIHSRLGEEFVGGNEVVAGELTRTISNVEMVRNNIVIKQDMGRNESLRGPAPTQQTLSGEVSRVEGDGFRVKTDQGELHVSASQCYDKKGELDLRQGDNVLIRGYMSGFGEQRHIVAQEISAKGKTVTFQSSERLYRETGAETR